MTGSVDRADALVEDYFAALAAAAARTGAPIGPDEVAELRAHVAERLAATAGTADDARRVLQELGEPARLAGAFAEAGDERDGRPGTSGEGPLTGRVLGMPYDLRTPTSDRCASRMWDPSNPDVLVPKALGIGWTVNFGALAVKLHLVRPDDEDAPFAAAPDEVVRGSLAPAAVLVLLLSVLVAVRWPSLPATLPTHWDALGRADGYSSRGAAVVLLEALAGVPLLLAIAVHARAKPAFNRVAASALSLGFAALALGIFVQTVLTAGGHHGMWPSWLGIAGFVVLPLLLLVGVSRLGRAAEQRRDLSWKGQSW